MFLSDRGVSKVSASSGCALSGFVLVKKVPGTLHFLAKSSGHSFNYAEMNMSHVVNYLFMGQKPSQRRRKVRSACWAPMQLDAQIVFAAWMQSDSRRPLLN